MASGRVAEHRFGSSRFLRLSCAFAVEGSFDELNPVFWRRTAAVLWAGVVIVALSTGIESFNWPQIVGWVMVAGGVIATATRMGMSYYRQYSAHNVRRAKFTNPRFSGPRATGR